MNVTSPRTPGGTGSFTFTTRPWPPNCTVAVSGGRFHPKACWAPTGAALTAASSDANNNDDTVAQHSRRRADTRLRTSSEPGGGGTAMRVMRINPSVL